MRMVGASLAPAAWSATSIGGDTISMLGSTDEHPTLVILLEGFEDVEQMDPEEALAYPALTSLGSRAQRILLLGDLSGAMW